MNEQMNGAEMPQIPLEDFERQARAQMAYESEDRQITTLIHLIYHTLDSSERQTDFLAGLEMMKDLNAN